MTPAEHAATVREALGLEYELQTDQETKRALDALLALAERATELQAELDELLESRQHRRELWEQTRTALQAYDDWASRMPDAGFTSESPRWAWWHERPYAQARAALDRGTE